jgi:hypothetical protein
MSCVFLSGFRKLCPFLVLEIRPSWGLAPRCVGLLVACVALATSPNSQAEEGRPRAPQESSTHLALGPQAAASFANDAWDSEIGGELHLAWLREGQLLSVIGAGFGVAGYSRGDSYQLSLDLYLGSDLLGDVPVGISVGPVLRAFQEGGPQVGGRTTLWLYHGIMPYCSLSWLGGPRSPAQPGLEIGVKIPFSIWDW